MEECKQRRLKSLKFNISHFPLQSITISRMRKDHTAELHLMTPKMTKAMKLVAINKIIDSLKHYINKSSFPHLINFISNKSQIYSQIKDRYLLDNKRLENGLTYVIQFCRIAVFPFNPRIMNNQVKDDVLESSATEVFVINNKDLSVQQSGSHTKVTLGTFA